MSDGAVTVLLVPDALHDDVGELAAAWVDAWLLDPLYLVRTGAAALAIEPGDAVARVAASHVVRRQVRPVPDLTAHIAERSDGADGADVGLLRVVELVASARITSRPRDELRAEADMVAATLKRAANRRHVHRVALIVLTTDERIRADGLRQPAWEANVLAVPENRSVPAGWEGFVRMSETRGFAGFALAHAATVGGLWAGMREGAWDDVHRQGDDHVELQRVTVRAVLHGDRRIRDAFRSVLLLTSDGHDPVTAGVATLRAPDGARVGTLDDRAFGTVAGEFVRSLLDGPDGRPLRARLPERGGSAAWGEAPRGGPRALLEAMRRLVSDAVGRVLGRASRDVPTGPPAPDPALGARLEALAERLARAVEGRTVTADGTTLARWPRSIRDRQGSPAAVGVWRPLHDRAGLLLDAGVRRDATELAAWAVERGLVGVAPRVGMVVPDRADAWRFPEDLLGTIDRRTGDLPTEVAHTDLLGLRTWEAVLAPWLPTAEAVVEAAEAAEAAAEGSEVATPVDGSAGMTLAEARRLLAVAGELGSVVATVSASAVGRLLRSWQDEDGRAAAAVDAVRAAIAGPPVRPTAPRRRGVVAAAVAAVAALAGVAAVRPVLAVGVALLGAVAAVALVAARRGPRRHEDPVDLEAAASALLRESGRCEGGTDDLQAMVELLSHLVHHGVRLRPPETTDRLVPDDEDLPMLVRIAVPHDPDGEDATHEEERVSPALLVCLEDLLETGWRTRCHDELLGDVVARERLLPAGTGAADALHGTPGLAREVLWRLASGGGDYEARVAEGLVRRGVRSLEGSLRPEQDAPARLTRPGMPGAPGSTVQVVDRVTPSADVRRDALTRSLGERPNWDDFLLAGVGGDDPWSASHFVRHGAGERAIERRRSRVHGPVRLRARAERADVDVEFVPLRGDGGSHAEVVLRVDTQPDALHVEALRFFDVAEG